MIAFRIVCLESESGLPEGPPEGDRAMFLSPAPCSARAPTKLNLVILEWLAELIFGILKARRSIASPHCPSWARAPEPQKPGAPHHPSRFPSPPLPSGPCLVPWPPGRETHETHERLGPQNLIFFTRNTFDI
jgi:hypothetical protein